MNLFTLERILDEKLSSHSIKDYVPNGLQIEGRHEVKRIVTGVTATMALIERAIEAEADAILVHHGYFWKSESPLIRGMKYRRIKALMDHDLSLLAYHLPLDLHPELGNNAQLGKMWGVEGIQPLNNDPESALILEGSLPEALTPEVFSSLLQDSLLGRAPLHCGGEYGKKMIKRIAWCSGAAQDYLDRAADAGVDAFITGEVSERTTHIARERGIHFFAAGHHATERCGVTALGEWLEREHGLSVQFIDDDNPV